MAEFFARLRGPCFGRSYTEVPAKKKKTDSGAKPGAPRIETDESRLSSHYVPEDEWQASKHGVFFPVSRIKQNWDLLVMAWILYSCVMVPFELCIDEASRYTRIWWFNQVVQVSARPV